MLTRRQLIESGAVLAPMLLPWPALATTDNPVTIVKDIYTRAAKGRGDSGGDFVIGSSAARAKYLSASLAALWDKAEAQAPKDEPGPVDFDPVSNSQDPDIKSFTVAGETQSDDRATVAATIAGRHGKRAKAADNVIRYDFVRENGQWRIDDMRGAVEGDPWSIRGILNDALKAQSGKR